MAIVLLCVLYLCIPATKTTNAGSIKGNTKVGTSIYGNINKKASKLRHAMASQGKQGKPGKAKQSQA